MLSLSYVIHLRKRWLTKVSSYQNVQSVKRGQSGYLAGRIDATLNAEVTYYDYKKEHPNAAIKIACIDPQTTSVAIPMRKDDDSATLRAAVNSALEELLADGTISAISIKYFGGDITKN